MNTTPSKTHNTVGGSVGILGGIVLYITSHLGTAFYALLLLVFLNVVAAMWSKDLISALHKWLKVIMGVAIPFVTPMLTQTQGLNWTTSDTKILVGLVFAALLASTVPELLVLAQKVMTSFHVPKSDQKVLLSEAQAEIARLSALVEKQNGVPVTTPSTPSYAVVSSPSQEKTP